MTTIDGRVIVGDNGVVLGADAVAATLLGQSHDLPGRSVLDLFVPADRDRLVACLQQVRDNGTPAIVVAQALPADGPPLPIRCRLSRHGDGIHLLLAAGTSALSGVRPDTPADLLRLARLLLAARIEARHAFSSLLTADHGWDTLLAIFVHEDEGQPFTIAALLRLIGGPERIVRRWLAALAYDGMIHLGAGDGGPDGERLRLSPAVHSRLILSLAATTRREATGT